MNRIFLIFLLSLSVLASPALQAQELVRFPTGPAAWRVDIVPGPKDLPIVNSPGNVGGIKTINVTQMNDIRRNLLTWETGPPTERWMHGKSQLVIATDTHDGSPSLVSKKDVAMGGDFAVGFDAPAFQWINQSNFKDKVTYKGKDTLHYVAKVTIARELLSPDGHPREEKIVLHCEAWVEDKTLLPVALYDGSKMGEFTFLPPPVEPPKPPPAIEKVIEQYTASSIRLK